MRWLILSAALLCGAAMAGSEHEDCPFAPAGEHCHSPVPDMHNLQHYGDRLDQLAALCASHGSKPCRTLAIRLETLRQATRRGQVRFEWYSARLPGWQDVLSDD